MMNIKNKKTTYLGIIAMSVLVVAMIALFFGKVTLTEITKFLSPLALFLGAVLAWISKDHDN